MNPLLLLIALTFNGHRGIGDIYFATPFEKGLLSVGFSANLVYGPWGINPLTENPPESTLFILGNYYPAIGYTFSKHFHMSFSGAYHMDNIFGKGASAGIGEITLSFRTGKKLSSNSYFSIIPQFMIPIEWSQGLLRRYNTGMDYGVVGALSMDLGSKNHLHFNLGAYNRDNAFQGAGLIYGVFALLYSRSISRLDLFARFMWNPILTYPLYDVKSVYGKSPVKIGLGVDYRFLTNWSLYFGIDSHLRHRKISGVVLKPTIFPSEDPSIELSLGISYTRKPRVPELLMSIEGKVYDASTMEPLIAEIIVPKLRLYMKSGIDGKFYIEDIEPGEYLITVNASGYKPVSFRIHPRAGGHKRLSVGLRPITARISGKIIDSQTGEPLEGYVYIEPDGMKIFAKNGSFSVELPYGVHVIEASTDFGTDTRVVAISDEKPLAVELSISGIKGSVIAKERVRTNFPAIYFAFDSYDILPKEAVKLDRVAEILKSNPDLKVEIAGHASSDGPFSYNLALSLKRALAVRDYLVKKGVHPDMLIPRGYGETRISKFNRTEQERAFNRRVDFVVVN